MHMRDHVAHDARRLSRASLPADTTELARYLIGKTIVRRLEETGSAAALSKPRLIPRGIRVGMLTAGNRQATAPCFWVLGLPTCAQVCASAFLTKSAGCCASLMWATPSLAAQVPSRKNKKSFGLPRNPANLGKYRKLSRGSRRLDQFSAVKMARLSISDSGSIRGRELHQSC